MLEHTLSRISQISKTGTKVQNLAHLLDKEMLTICFKELDPHKASGIDRVTKEEYGKNLNRNLDELIKRMKGGTYSPKPSKRVYIDKPGTNKKRPLGISCFEDKIVERAIAKVLNAVYESKFLGCSYGFRPRRNCHVAVSTLLRDIHGRTSFVVEADIRSCFDTINHEWLIKCLQHDIADRRFIDLIKRGIEAGHFEDGMLHIHTQGTMQGSGYSPVLCNVYLHYVLDRWFMYLKSKVAPPDMRFQGEATLLRYADDFVATFQYREDAEKFYRELGVRFSNYGLALAEEKTRILAFGRFAADEAVKLYGKGIRQNKKPDTFDFLGFTFYCSKSRVGKFSCKVKTAAKRMRTKLTKVKEWIKENRDMSIEKILDHLSKVLNGYFNYYAVSGNSQAVGAFKSIVLALLFKWLNRRSQRRSFTWDEFYLLLKRPNMPKLPNATIRVNIYTYRDKWLLEEPCA